MLRGVTLAGKFLLVIFLARYTSLEVLGVYGLIATSVVMVVQVLGFDFYVFNARLILAAQNRQRMVFVRDQAAFHVLAHVLIIPCLLLLFVTQVLPWALAAWVFPLVVLEHITQEGCRLLVTLSRPLAANLILFLRGGIWAVVFVAVAFLFDEFRSMQWLLSFWLGGSFFAVLVLWFVLRGYSWTAAIGRSVDWPWVRKGVMVAMPFFIATLAQQSIEVADRFILQAYHGKAVVGVYVFSQNIAGLLQTALVTGFISIVSPPLVRAFLRKQPEEYRRRMRALLVGVVLAGLLGIVLLAGLFPVFAWLSGKSELIENEWIFWILLAAGYFSVLALVPYYGMYARGLDRELLLVMLLAASMNMVLNFLWVPEYGMLGAAWATCIAFFAVALLRAALLFFRGRRVPLGL